MDIGQKQRAELFRLGLDHDADLRIALTQTRLLRDTNPIHVTVL